MVITITNFTIVPSTLPAPNSAADGYAQITIEGSGSGSIPIKKNGIIIGNKTVSTTAVWPLHDDLHLSVGTFQVSVTDATHTITKSVTISGTAPPPPTGCATSITSTSITLLVSSGLAGSSVGFTSTIVGGVPTGEGFKHEIFFDGVSVYASPVGKDYTHSNTFNVPSGASLGSHNVTTKITDGCLPTHQSKTSPAVTFTVTNTAPPPTNNYGCVNGVCTANSGSLPAGCNNSCTSPPPTGGCTATQMNIPLLGCKDKNTMYMYAAGIGIVAFLLLRKRG